MHQTSTTQIEEVKVAFVNMATVVTDVNQGTVQWVEINFGGWGKGLKSKHFFSVLLVKDQSLRIHFEES